MEPGVATRHSPMRAIVAIEHAMIIAAHNVLTNGDFYRDPVANYYTAHQSARTEVPGYQPTRNHRLRVTLEPVTESA